MKAAGVALALAFALAAEPVVARAADPQPRPGRVEIYRDRFGMPHIYAASEQDGFYALGYAQAEDNGRAILAFALAAEGRSAAVFGTEPLPWGNPAAATDIEALRWRIAEQARAGLAALPPNLRQQLESYASGFRAYARHHPGALPDWGIRFEAWHALALPNLALWFFNVGDGLRKCAADGAKLSWSTIALQQERHASNEWAVAPVRAGKGTTILLSDPHGPIPAGGNPFYEFRMKAGALDVTGYAIGPLMALSHSTKVAWGLTTGGPDVSDCYRLRVAGNRYRLGDAWYDFDVRRHRIEVAKGEAKPLEVKYAMINGRPAPVVSERNGYAYAVSTPYWGALGDLFVQFDGMIRAADAQGVMDAAAVQGMFPQNLLIADAKGSIVYVRGGRTPRRDPAVDPSRALPGDDARTQWRGIHPLRDLVTLRNPPTGYLQNNNATPSNMTEGPPLLKASDYPAYIWNDNAQEQFWDRAARVNEVLSAKRHFSIDDAMKLALDQKWVASERWTGLLRRATAQPGAPHFAAGSDEARMLERLLSFDGVAAKESVAALDFYFWRTAVVARAGARLAAVEEQIAGTTPPTQEAMDILVRAVVDAVALMRQRVGTIDRAYGDWFRIGRSPDRHFPVGGGPSIEWSDMSWCQAHQRPAFTCSFTHRAFVLTGRTADGRPEVTYGSRALRLVVLGREFQSYSLHNFGQSDDPKSPHWDDQAEQLSSGHRLRRVPFTFKALAGETSAHITLRVED